MSTITALFYGIFVIIILVLLLIAFKLLQLQLGRKQALKQLGLISIKKFDSIGSIQDLKIMPLIDYYTDRANVQTEAGVSYLLQVDGKKILFDLGYNKNKKHPSPLLHNLQELGYQLDDLDLIFISHLHCDHVGGNREEKAGTFSVSQGPVNMPAVTVYAPTDIKPSKWNPGPEVKIIKEPYLIDKGIASIGVIPRYLFLLGLTLEQSLAINVAGKGIVLIIGCGHQGVEKIIERTKLLFDEPIYAIVGGLHFPVKGGRMNIGPFNMQQIVATDEPPWRGVNQKRVQETLTAIKDTGAKVIALSAHDSSDWSLELFKNTFQGNYVPLKAGKEIII